MGPYQGGEEEQGLLATPRRSHDGVPVVSQPAISQRRIKVALYVSYFLAAWAWRGMEFTTALVLIDLYPKSLLLVSLYGLLDNGFRVTLGSIIGGYIDRSTRWRGARDCYIMQNACIVGAGLSLSVVLMGMVGAPGNPNPNDQAQYWAVVAVALVFSALSSVGSSGVTITVEKRMPQVLCSPRGSGRGAALALAPSASSPLARAQDSASAPLLPSTPPASGPSSSLSSASPSTSPHLAAASPTASPNSTNTGEGGGNIPMDGERDSQEMAAMNSVFRAIDLTCLLASPMVSGFVMTYWSPAAAVLLLVVYCLLAWGPELLLLRWAVVSSTQLRDPHTTTAEAAEAAAACSPSAAKVSPLPSLSLPPLLASKSLQWDHHEEDLTETSPETSRFAPRPALDQWAQAVTAANGFVGPSPFLAKASKGPEEGLPPPLLLPGTVASDSGCNQVPGQAAVPPAAKASDSCTSGWALYFRQPVLLANLALAVLYMTVLSLGFLMTSYLKWAGLTEAEISLFRGVGAVTGLAATAVYPALQRCMGAVRMGLLGVYYQLGCLALGVVPVLLTTMALGAEQRPALWQVRLLIGSVVASRSGLWLFDLAVTQVVQDNVAPGELGTVCGVQNSVQAIFETASFVAGCLLVDPSQFWMLMLGSLCVVAAAAALHTAFALSHSNMAYQRLPRHEDQQLSSAV